MNEENAKVCINGYLESTSHRRVKSVGAKEYSISGDGILKYKNDINFYDDNRVFSAHGKIL